MSRSARPDHLPPPLLHSFLPSAKSGSVSVQFKAKGFWHAKMVWALFAIFLAILWVVSLCFLLFASCTPSATTFLSSQSDSRKRNVLLVVAHPDDESMFFAPTILYLTSGGHNLHILCLSTGNVDGKGNIRKEELYKACSTMKVPLQQVQVLDHPALQDGFGNSWDHCLIAEIVEEEINKKGVDLLITFDNYGVSGHRNHRDVHLGICTVLCGKSEKNIEAWELISTSLMRKYIGPVDIWLSLLSCLHNLKGQLYCLVNGHPHKSFIAMAQHESQWIWFRKLFVLFSRYTYMNTLKRINM